MKFGILRNIAGNHDALLSADKWFDSCGVDVRVCLGQIVGIYPFVDACVELLVHRNYTSLRRLEDDEFVAGCDFHGWSTTHLIEALRFSLTLVSRVTLEYLTKLPVRAEINGVAFESRAPVKDGVLYDKEQARAAFELWKNPVVIHAAHFDPFVWRDDLSGSPLEMGRNELHPGGRMLISTGGVGSRYQGSVNTRKPVAMMFDDEEMVIQLWQPACNIGALFSKLRSMDYPSHVLKALEGFEYAVWRM